MLSQHQVQYRCTISRTTSRSFICLRSFVRHLVRTTLAYTVPKRRAQDQQHAPQFRSLTVRSHDNENDHRQCPFEENAEKDEGEANIDERGNDIEEDEFQGVIYCGATIENAKNFACLAVRVEREGQVEQVIERQLRHLCSKLAS